MPKFSDERPILYLDDDVLGFDYDVKGLSMFIKEVQTPFTISIQGEWGSGKTSYINMVIKDLLGIEKIESIDDSEVQELPEENNDYKFIRMNAWDFTQFNDESISNSMLRYFADQTVLTPETKKKVYAVLENRKIRKFGRNITELIGAVIPAVGNVVEIVKNNQAILLEEEQAELAEQAEQEAMNPVKKIDIFKQNITDDIKTNGKKHIIFIDDLDRIHPTEVVEILEAIQVFMSIENCVFILAVDYDVVNQGFKNKFKDFDNNFNASKYFDKLIQLPITMPKVNNTKIKEYIDKLFSSIKDYPNDKTQKEVIHTLISDSVGRNPRNLKSLANSLVLQSQEFIMKDQKFPLDNYLFLEGLKLEFKPFYELMLKHSAGNIENLGDLEFIVKIILDRDIEYLLNTNPYEMSSDFHEENTEHKVYADSKIIQDIRVAIELLCKENTLSFEANATRLDIYLKNINGLLYDGDTFNQSYHKIMGLEVLEDNTIARIAISSKYNEKNFKAIESLVKKWHGYHLVKQVYLLETAPEVKQILIEFKVPVDRKNRDIIKKLLLDNEIYGSIVTSHRLYYPDRSNPNEK